MYTSSVTCLYLRIIISVFFFFNDTATTEIYTLSLHDALPISKLRAASGMLSRSCRVMIVWCTALELRSEEHTSELQSHVNLVCRLLLEKKKNEITIKINAVETGEEFLQENISPLHSGTCYT